MVQYIDMGDKAVCMKCGKKMKLQTGRDIFGGPRKLWYCPKCNFQDFIYKPGEYEELRRWR